MAAAVSGQSCPVVATTGVVNLFSKVDTLKKISEVTTAIFDFLEHMGHKLGNACKALGTTLSHFVDLCSVVAVLKHIKNWTCPEDGKMLWQQAWQGVVSMVCLTAYDVLTFVKFLGTTLKVFDIGLALTPVKLGINAFLGTFALFDTWVKANKLVANSSEMDELQQTRKMCAEIKQDFDNGRSPNLTQRSTDLDAQIKVHTASGDQKKLKTVEKMKSLVDDWIQNAGRTLGMQAERKIEILDPQIANLKISNTKTWVGIAANVTLIALMALCIVTAFVAPAWVTMAVLLGSAITANALDLTTSVVDEYLVPQQVPVEV